jgi:hypothetical protein
LIKQSQPPETEAIVELSGRAISPVTDPLMYASDFPIFLRQRMRGKTVDEVAGLLDVPAEHVLKLLGGEWRPTKAICKKMGLRMVYAVTDAAPLSLRAKSGLSARS